MLEMASAVAKNNNTSISTSNYNKSKYNALKHGVLSKYTVMHWENRDEYNSLLSSLINDYSPQCITEEHLVVELAGIIWRKMRLRYAETASLQSSLSRNVGIDNLYSSNDSAKDALLAKSREVENFNIKKAILLKDNKTQDELRIAKKLLDSCLEAEKILKETNSYEDGLEALPIDDRNNWENEEGFKGDKYGSFSDRCKYVDTAESLLSWVVKAINHYEKLIYELKNREKVKKQILGRAFLSDQDVNKYVRYENHLDKKFEKTLAMLLKIQDLKKANDNL
jgi:hypothetical protein